MHAESKDNLKNFPVFFNEYDQKLKKIVDRDI